MYCCFCDISFQVILPDIPVMKVVGTLKIEKCIWTLLNVDDIIDKTHISLEGGKLICNDVSITSYSIPGLRFLGSVSNGENKVLNCERLIFQHDNDNNVENGHFNLLVGISEISDSV
jgi:hypothetical protein